MLHCQLLLSHSIKSSVENLVFWFSECGVSGEWNDFTFTHTHTRLASKVSQQIGFRLFRNSI